MNWPLYRDLKADVLFEFNRFPELSRTSGLFPGLSSPGKRNKFVMGVEIDATDDSRVNDSTVQVHPST